MDQASKLVLYAGIITATIFILVLVQGKGSSGMMMLLFMVLALVLCHCFKDCRYASMYALFNLILAINAFDTVGLILIGSKPPLLYRKAMGWELHILQHHSYFHIRRIYSPQLHRLAALQGVQQHVFIRC